MFKRLAGLLLVALFPLTSLAQEAAAAPPAPAAAPAAASTINRHLGFFIRPELGVGYFGTSASQGGLEVELSGGAFNFGLAIGGAVSEDFILAGQVWDYVVSSPDATVNGQSESLSDTSVALIGYGVLLNWYFMPSNLYVAVTPSITRLSFDDGTSTFNSEWGFGLRGAVGKEWWVSDHWGLGLAGSLALSSNKDTGTDPPTWGSWAIGLSFSATYN